MSALMTEAELRNGDWCNEDPVVLSREEYNSLVEDREFLQRLQAAGVDNWEGYEYA